MLDQSSSPAILTLRDKKGQKRGLQAVLVLHLGDKLPTGCRNVACKKVWFINQQDVRSRPHFNFVLESPTFPGLRLPLTNDSLFFHPPDPNGTYHYYPTNILLVPVNVNSSNVAFNLTVDNDSSVESDQLDVFLQVPPRSGCIPSSGWRPARREGLYVVPADEPSSREQVKAWACRTGRMLPRQAEVLPLYMANS